MNQLFVEPGPEPADEAVLAERLPLIAGEDQERVVHAPQPAHGLEQLAQAVVGQSHASRVGPPQAEQLGLAEHVPHRPRRDVDQGGDVIDLDLVGIVLGLLHRPGPPPRRPRTRRARPSRTGRETAGEGPTAHAA